MEATQEKTPLELLESGQITTLEQLFIATDTNFQNLHERLGITVYKLTRVKNNPSKECDFELLKDISQLTGIACTILLEHLNLGGDQITYNESKELALEEIITPKA